MSLRSTGRKGCGCACHTSPHVMHCIPCCDYPPARFPIKQMKLTFEEYQRHAVATAVYPMLQIYPDDVKKLDFVPSFKWLYPALGLCGEAGEIAEKIKKLVRDKEGIVDDNDRAAIKKELGDVMWYVAALCKEFDLDMGEVAQGNLDKLAARAARGTLGGSGDDR